MRPADELLDAVQRAVGEKPLYLLAGASDLVNEKLRELPRTLSSLQANVQDDYKDLPMRAVATLAGQFFRANLKAGQLYDDLTRRGEEVVAKMRGEPVVAEEDEPYVREPFMPVPVHEPERLPVVPPTNAVVKQAPAKKTAAKKTAAKKSAAKAAGAKKTAAKKAAAKKAAKKTPAKKTAARKAAASA